MVINKLLSRINKEWHHFINMIYGCEIVSKNNNELIIQSKRYWSLIALLMFINFIIVIIVYFLLGVKDAFVFEKILIWLAYVVFAITFLAIIFSVFLLSFYSVVASIKNKHILLTKRLFGIVISKKNYSIYALYPIKKEILHKRCLLKFKIPNIPQLAIYSNDLDLTQKTIQKCTAWVKSSTQLINECNSQNNGIVIYKFIYRWSKDSDVSYGIDINNETKLVDIPSSLKNHLQEYFTGKFARGTALLLSLADGGFVKMCFFETHVSCAFCFDISSIESDLINVLSIYASDVCICEGDSIKKISLDSIPSERIFCKSSNINKISPGALTNGEWDSI